MTNHPHPLLTAPTRETPPDAATLRRALRVVQLRNPSPKIDRWETVVVAHLASPVDAAVGPDVIPDVDGWTYRGVTLHDSDDPSAAADAFAQASARPGDRWLDLDQCGAVGWCKLLRSGTHRMLFGAPLLLGTPTITAEVGVDADIVYALTSELVATPRHQVDLPAVITLFGHSVVVEGNAERWTMRNLTTGLRRHPTDPAEAAIELARALVAEVRGAIITERRSDTTRVRYLIEAGAWQMIVPAELTATATRYGYEPADTDLQNPEPADDLPAGYTAIGRIDVEHAVAARHDITGIIVALRRHS